MSQTPTPAVHPHRGSAVAAWAIRLAILAMAAALVIVFVLDWSSWVGGRSDQSTNDAYLQSDLTPLGARVAGIVRAVPVGDFARVHAGDLLVELIDDDYKAQVLQAEANVAAAAASVETYAGQRALQETNINAAQAVQAATEANATRARLEAQRQRSLLSTGVAGTRQNVEQADASEKQFDATLAQNAAQVEGQRRQVDVLGAQEKQAGAMLALQRATLSLATINLGYTRITAPVDGVVGQRQVRPGQYVAPGTSVISLVPDAVWVIANFKETQMTRVRVGQPADVTVDAFPGMVLHGHVDNWSPASGSAFALLPPDNATGNFTKVVQRIPVKIVLDGTPDRRLEAGLSVVATVHTGDGGQVK